MKLYCELCSKTQPVRIDNCRDAKTNEPYQDIVCAECDFVIASGTGIAQPEQEPVAWADKVGAVIPHSHKLFQPDLLKDYTRPLYTAPPKRQWVGLTDEERFLNDCRSPEEIEYAIAIEAKLKERNT